MNKLLATLLLLPALAFGQLKPTDGSGGNGSGGGGPFGPIVGTGGITVTSNSINGKYTIDGSAVIASGTNSTIRDLASGLSVTAVTQQNFGLLLTGAVAGATAHIGVDGNAISNIANYFGTNTGAHITNSVWARTTTNDFYILNNGYNIFWDDFEGATASNYTSFISRKSPSGHSYSLFGPASNSIYMADGYIQNTNDTINNQWYLAVTNATPGLGLSDWQAGAWTRFGCILSYTGTFGVFLPVVNMGTIGNTNDVNDLGIHSGFWSYYVRLQRALAEDIIGSSQYYPVDNPGGIYTLQKHLFEVQWYSNSFQVRFDDYIVNGYSTNGLAWANKPCFFFEIFDCVTNLARVKMHSVWAGKAYPEYVEAQRGATYRPATNDTFHYRYTTPALSDGTYTNLGTDIYVGIGATPSPGATNKLPPIGTYWGREITIFDQAGTASGTSSNVSIIPYGGDTFEGGVTKMNITNSFGSLTVRSGPNGWHVMGGTATRGGGNFSTNAAGAAYFVGPVTNTGNYWGNDGLTFEGGTTGFTIDDANHSMNPVDNTMGFGDTRAWSLGNFIALRAETGRITNGLKMLNVTASRAAVFDANKQLTNAAGTPDGTKFLRDDNTYAVPPGGGDGTNFPPVIALSNNTNSTITVGSGVRQSVSRVSATNFTFNFSGTPLNGEQVELAVSNFSASTLFLTNTSGIYDSGVASNVTTFAVAGNSIRYFTFVNSTNLNNGVARWEQRNGDAGLKTLELNFNTNGLFAITNGGLLTVSNTHNALSNLFDVTFSRPIGFNDILEIGADGNWHNYQPFFQYFINITFVSNIVINVGTNSEQSLAITASNSFGLTYSGTPSPGERFHIAVFNTNVGAQALSSIYMTNNSYNPIAAANQLRYEIRSNSIASFTFVNRTNWNSAGTNRWELESWVGYQVPGNVSSNSAGGLTSIGVSTNKVNSYYESSIYLWNNGQARRGLTLLGGGTSAVQLGGTSDGEADAPEQIDIYTKNSGYSMNLGPAFAGLVPVGAFDLGASTFPFGGIYGSNVFAKAAISADTITVNSATVSNNIGYIINVLTGKGTTASNYTIQANMAKSLGGSNDVNIVAIMGGQPGVSYFGSTTFTNQSNGSQVFGVSSVTNSWHWSGPNGTNPPTSIPAHFEMNIAWELRGASNVVAGWMTNGVVVLP